MATAASQSHAHDVAAMKDDVEERKASGEEESKEGWRRPASSVSLAGTVEVAIAPSAERHVTPPHARGDDAKEEEKEASESQRTQGRQADARDVDDDDGRGDDELNQRRAGLRGQEEQKEEKEAASLSPSVAHLASAAPPSPSPVRYRPPSSPLLPAASSPSHGLVAPAPGWLRAGSIAQPSATPSPPLLSSSSSSSTSVTLTFAARHLPPSISPILCLLQLRPDGSERLLGHTEVHSASMSPAWKKRLTMELSRGGASQHSQRFRLAVFDASNLAHPSGRQEEEEEQLRAEAGRGSLLHRLLLRRTSGVVRGAAKEEGGRGIIAASELSADDLVGGVIVELAQVASASRHLVTQRLHIRHPSDHDIDRRLLRLSAHILLTAAPSIAHPSALSPRHSPRLAAASSAQSGPSCLLPFSAAYRLLCKGAVFLKFPFSSSAKPQPRLVFFSRHPLTATQVVAQAHPLFDPLTDQSPPNPLFPLGLLYWCSVGRKRCSARRCLPLHSISGLYEQCQTPAFTQLLLREERERHSSLQAKPATASSSLGCSFSIVSRERTLDLLADSAEVRDAFLFAIHSILVDQGRLWYADATAQDEKRQEERRRYNEKQTEHTCAVSFVAKHLPLQASGGEGQLRMRLSRARMDGGEDAAGERGEAQVLGWSEWVEQDDSMVFLTLFFLPLPEQSQPASSPCAEYHVHLYDLSHSLLATASFSSSLLHHPHLDIPLSLRHEQRELDALLTVQRSVCMMRVQAIAGPDKPKGDLLDVIALLQAQPSYNPSLPYLTLSFLLRGEACTYYPEPSFLVTPAVLQYNASSACLSLCGHELPLSSLLRVHRQLRPASQLYAALCAVHPEKRVNSKRMLVLDAGELGLHCVEMHSQLSADAWLSGLRQLRKKKGTASRAQLETEELQWSKRTGEQSQQLDDDDADEAEGDEQEENGGGSARTSKRGSLAESQPSVELLHSAPHTRGASRHRLSTDWRGVTVQRDEDDGPADLHTVASPWRLLQSAAEGVVEEEEELRVSRGAGQPTLSASDAADASGLDLNSAHLTRAADGAFREALFPAGAEGGEPAWAAEVESPDFHSQASSFSCLSVPDFHLHSPSSKDSDEEEEEEEENEGQGKEEEKAEEEKASEVAAEEAVAAAVSDEVPMAPPMLDDGPPPAPPMGGPPCPGEADDGGLQSAVKLKKLHWELLAAGCDVSSTVFSSLDCELDAESMELLVRLFAAQAPPSEVAEEEEARKAAAAKAASALVELIDPRRGQNLAIALRGLKMPIPVLIQALHSCDLQLLTLERVQTLLACHPDTLEVRQVRAYTGDEERLGVAERYIRAVSSVPRASTRLQLLLLLHTFADARSNLTTQLGLLSTACERLRCSVRLSASLQLVLAVGSALNAKKATGFRLSSLDKLNALKSRASSAASSSSSSSVSLLDFITERAMVQAAAFELDPPKAGSSFFAAELGPARLHEAAKVDWPALCNDVRALGEQLLTVKRERDREDMKATAQAPFRSVLNTFLASASPALAQLEGQLRSTTQLLQSTLSYFGQPDDSSPSELFSLVDRFVSHFHHSEARWWAKAAAEAKRAELEERKRRWKEEQEEERREQAERKRRTAEVESGLQLVDHIHYSTLTDAGEAAGSTSAMHGLEADGGSPAKAPPPLLLLHSEARPPLLQAKWSSERLPASGARWAGLNADDAKGEPEQRPHLHHPPFPAAALDDAPSTSPAYFLSLSSEHLTFF